MKKNHRSIIILTLSLLLVTGLVACSTSGNSDEKENDLMLRIANNTSSDDSENNLIYGDITVRLIPETDNPNFEGSASVVNFETLAVDEVSEYKIVPNVYTLEVNGEVFGDNFFSIDDQPSKKWLLEIQVKYDQGNGNYGYGWSQSAEF